MRIIVQKYPNNMIIIKYIETFRCGEKCRK